MNAVSGATSRIDVGEGPDLLKARVDQLYARAHIGFAATLVNSLIVVGVLREQVDPHRRWLWFAVLGLVTVWRFVNVSRYRRARETASFAVEPWASGFTRGIGVSGLVWGSAAIFMFPESVIHQIFLAFVIGGMVAGATATFSIRMEAYLAYTVPALLPLTVRIAAVGDELHLAMGAMIFLFGALLTGTAYSVHNAITRWLHVRVELDRAHADLAASHVHAEALTTDLEKARKDLSVHDDDANQRMVQYADDIAETFETLHEKLNRRLAAQQRASHHIQKAKSMTTFAHGVAQQLSGPLESISESLSLAWRHPDRMPSMTAVTAMLVAMEEANKEITTLMRQLLEYANQNARPFSAVDLSAVTKGAVDAWKLASDFDGELWLSLADLPPVDADPEGVALVVHHLLNNASEAARPGRAGIEVSTDCVLAQDIEREAACLHEPLSSAEFVVISVSDNGIGMPDDAIERIFDPFYTTKVTEQGFGRGFGLAMVSAVVRRHRGEITIASRALRGTTVRVFFPAGG